MKMTRKLDLAISLAAMAILAVVTSRNAPAALPTNSDVNSGAVVNALVMPETALLCALSHERAQQRDAEIRVLRQQFELALPGALTKPEDFLKTVGDIRAAVFEMRQTYGDTCVSAQSLGLPITLR